MTPEEIYIDLKKDNNKLLRDNKILKVENFIQTFAVIALFFFGVATVHDIVKKGRK